SRVREPDPLDRREPRADRLGEVDLAPGMCATAHSLPQRFDHRAEHDLIRMPVKPGRVLTEQVHVSEPVDIFEHRVPRPGDPERERLVVQDRPGVAARQETPRPVMQSSGLRAASREALSRLLDGVVYRVRVRTRRGLCHGAALQEGRLLKVKKLIEILVCFIHPLAVVLVWIDLATRSDLATTAKLAWAIFAIIPLVPFIYLLTGGDLW